MLKNRQHMTEGRVTQFLRSRFNPIRGLTPATLARQLDGYATGQLREIALTWDAIEKRDDVIRVVAQKRKKGVARRSYDILTLSDLPPAQEAEAQRHKEVLSWFYNNLEVQNAIDGNERGGFALLVRQMMDSCGKGQAVHEIVWHPNPDGLTATFVFVPLWFFEKRTGNLRFLESDTALNGVELEPGGWMVTTAEGVMEACSIAYLYKTMSLQDWVAYSEKFGTPGVLGKTDAAKGSEAWEAMEEAVGSLMNDWAAVCSTGDSMELLETKGGAGNLPFPPLVERMDRAIASLWRGADLSTLSAGSGSGQGASLQDQEGALLEADDAQLIQETLQQQVDARVIEYVFGVGVKPLAYLSVIVPPKVDIDGNIKVDEFLLRHGVRMSMAGTAERYGRSVADEEEEILVSSAGSNFASSGMDDGSSFGRPKGYENEARVGGAMRKRVGLAAAGALQPVAKRLEAIMAMEDPKAAAGALLVLKNDLARLGKDVDPGLVAALEESLAAGFVDGMESGNRQ